MFQEFSYYLIFGIPFIVYLGIFTIGLFCITAFFAVLKRKGKIQMSITWHYRLAIFSIILAFIHGILGVLAYL